MGKSFRKNPFIKTGYSNKWDRSIANRKFRREAKEALIHGKYEDLPKSMREVSDVWTFKSDGLAFQIDPIDNNGKYMRK